MKGVRLREKGNTPLTNIQTSVSWVKYQHIQKKGSKKLRDELQRLKDVERPAASQAIGRSAEGDFYENAEYDAAKEAQGMLEMRILS
jgi:SOS response regulatory protein OraA/RecX